MHATGREHAGFSLVELMIALVVVSILAAIAYPSYQSHMQRSRRADAQAALMGLAAAMERHYNQKMSYAGAADGNGVPVVFPSQAPLDGSRKYYDLQISSADVNGYTLLATPIGGQDGDGDLRLTGTGQRAWDKNDNGSFEADEQCWRRTC